MGKLVPALLALAVLAIVALLLVRRFSKSSLLDQANQILSSETADETAAAMLVGQAYEKYGPAARSVLERFIERYPTSLHPMRVFLAGLLAEARQYDEATEHARVYLRCVRDAGVFKDLANTTLIREGVSRAFLSVTCAYTEAGARSYSKRALELGCSLPITERWSETLRSEVQRLDEELKDHPRAELDAKWEALFASGDKAKELYDYCTTNAFPRLAQRVDLIESNHRFVAQSPVADVKKELFMLVREVDMHDKKNGKVLY